jgi:hypothetical protein
MISSTMLKPTGMADELTLQEQARRTMRATEI